MLNADQAKSSDTQLPCHLKSSGTNEMAADSASQLFGGVHNKFLRPNSSSRISPSVRRAWQAVPTLCSDYLSVISIIRGRRIPTNRAAEPPDVFIYSGSPNRSATLPSANFLRWSRRNQPLNHFYLIAYGHNKNRRTSKRKQNLNEKTNLDLEFVINNIDGG